MTIATDPKEIKYDHGDYRAAYEGNTIGWFNSYLEAEVALDDYASGLAQQTQVETADMAADAAIEPIGTLCEVGYCTQDATHTLTFEHGGRQVCCRHYETITGEFCTCPLFLTSDPPSTPDEPGTPPPWDGRPSNVFEMYCEAYGWSRVVLDDLTQMEQLTADHARIPAIL